MSQSKPIIVVGEGWAALGTLGFILKKKPEQPDQPKQKVIWIKGSKTRMSSPTPSFDASAEAGLGRRAWTDLAALWDIDVGEFRTGSFLREMRNKAFREPLWIKAPTPEDRQVALDETLWKPERRFVGVFEGRFAQTAFELEEALRAKIEALEDDQLRKIDGVPLRSVQIGDEGVEKVTLGSGEEIECSLLVYADRWSLLPQIEGVPASVQKLLSSRRKLDPTGILQAVFSHEIPIGTGISEGFMIPLNKESGEEMERRVWGYFSSDGKKSCWTICFSSEEVEDNHEIAKKLRRMKASLDKAFSGETWLGDEKKTFLSNLSGEAVRFEEGAIFAGGSPIESHADISAFPKKLANFIFLTDGFGPTYALDQVVMRLGLQQPSSQTEGVNPAVKATRYGVDS